MFAIKAMLRGKHITLMPSLLKNTKKNKGTWYIALDIRKRSNEINQKVLERNIMIEAEIDV